MHRVQREQVREQRGVREGAFQRAAGGLIRSVLQQLEETKVVEKTASGGRRITRVGQQDLDRIAGQVARGGNEE